MFQLSRQRGVPLNDPDYGGGGHATKEKTGGWVIKLALIIIAAGQFIMVIAKSYAIIKKANHYYD